MDGPGWGGESASEDGDSLERGREGGRRETSWGTEGLGDSGGPFWPRDIPLSGPGWPAGVGQ